MEATSRFLLLGSVEAVRNGERLPLGGRRQRALLALLLLETRRSVASDRLIDELWQGRPPAGASVTLRSYVSRLRAALGPNVMIEASASGYSIDVAPDQIDAKRFALLVREGREALARGAVRRAAERLHAGLDLWRGRPFGDLADEGALRLEAERLEELHLLGLQLRIEAELALGASAELVDELESLVRSHPHRERLWGQLMLALYRSQRQADALAAYHRARTYLVEELGLEPSAELRRLERDILRQDVASVLPPETHHNLPAAVTSFVGRQTELAGTEVLLGQARLVTLTGVGGVGKTRLALEVAERAAQEFADGVCFVDLSSMADPRLIERSVALALRLGEHDEAVAGDVLLAHLRSANMLLVLDNCEHVREGCAALIARLLSACGGVRVLATSRERLGAPGEVDYPVPPLGLPSREAGLPEVRASEAVRLFFARARAARTNLVEDAGAVATAAEICFDLDGIPLAIELAAARASALSFEDIAIRLSDRFRFLVSGRRMASARHRTLREAMDWSYELLAAEEQGLLAQLSVFAGEFSLAAAASVCFEGDDERALALIERLLAASLVIGNERDGEMRYRLLETVRQYAAGHLEGDAAERARRAHARFYLGVAEGADLTAIRRRPAERLDVAVAAQDNLRSALSWSLASGSIAFGLQLATSLERFWFTHSPDDGVGWFGSLLSRPEASTIGSELRANALRAYGGAMSLTGRDDAAEALWQESFSLFEDLGDEHGQALLLHRLAISAMRRGDLARARELGEASLAYHERTGDRSGLAQAVGTLGGIDRDAGDEARAIERMTTAADLAREIGSLWYAGGLLAELANLALSAGRIDEAERRAREALTIAEHMGDRAGRIFGVGLLARVAMERGQLARAQRLWTAVEEEDVGAPLGGWRRHRAAYAAVMGDHRVVDAEWVDWPRLTLDEAARLALEGSWSRGPGSLESDQRPARSARRT